MSVENYFRIARREIPPRFHITSRIPSGMDSAGAEILPIDDLIKKHDELVKPFYLSPSPDIPDYFPRNEISLLELKRIIARKMLKACTICENRCGIDRTDGKRGKCRVGDKSFYASEFIHLGEEPEIVPSHTVFFTGCTFECIYCQNWDIAHGSLASRDGGYPADETLIKRIMGKEKSVRNLNLVGGNPDQHLPNILGPLIDLAKKSYSRPIVWNSNLYMTPDAISLLTGVADLHLADFKYGSNECGEELSLVKGYRDVITRNLLAVKPVSDILIRHLVLPGHVECCTKEICSWVSENLPDAIFNLMFQYHPEYRAHENPTINRFLSGEEKEKALRLASSAGLL